MRAKSDVGDSSPVGHGRANISWPQLFLLTVRCQLQWGCVRRLRDSSRSEGHGSIIMTEATRRSSFEIYRQPGGFTSTEYIEWERRWAQIGTVDSTTDEDGFRHSDWSYSGKTIKRGGQPLADFDTGYCSVLFGPAGRGKSTELRKLAGRLRDEGEIPVLLIDLKEANLEELDNSVTSLIDSPANNRTAHLLLDSLDEALMLNQPTYALDIAKRLAKWDQTTLRIRIATRPHPFNSQIIEKLRQVNGTKKVIELELLPLERSDIEKACLIFGVNPVEFKSWASSNQIAPLCADPLTLLWLIQDFAEKKISSLSKVQLYERALERLAGEVSPSNSEFPALARHRDIGERLVLAENIAAAMSFGGFARFTSRDVSDPGSETLTASAIEPLARATAEIDGSPSAVADCLRSGLFRSASATSVAFVHMSIQEFLTARWLRRQGLSWIEMCELLWHEEPSRPYPQYSGVISWLISLDSSIARDAVAQCPTLAFNADTSTWTDGEKDTILRSLLIGYSDGRLPSSALRYHDFRPFRTIVSSQIIGQFLEPDGFHVYVQYEAMDIAAQFGLKDLAPAVLQIALHKQPLMWVRTHAIHVLSSLLEAEAVDRYVATLLSTSEPKIVRATSRCFWKKGLTTAGVLDLALKYRDCECLDYGFWDEVLADGTAKTQELVLSWLVKFLRATKGHLGYHEEKAFEKLFLEPGAVRLDAAHSKAFVKIAVELMEHQEFHSSIPDKVVHAIESSDIKLDLARDLVRINSKSNYKHPQSLWNIRKNLTSAEIQLALVWAKKARTPEVAARRYWFVLHTDGRCEVPLFELRLRVADADHRVREWFPDFYLCPIDSPSREHFRQFQDLERKRKARRRASPPPDIRKLIADGMQKEAVTPSELWQLVWCLNQDPETGGQHEQHPTAIALRPGYHSLTAAEKQKLQGFLKDYVKFARIASFIHLETRALVILALAHLLQVGDQEAKHLFARDQSRLTLLWIEVTCSWRVTIEKCPRELINELVISHGVDSIVAALHKHVELNPTQDVYPLLKVPTLCQVADLVEAVFKQARASWHERQGSEVWDLLLKAKYEPAVTFLLEKLTETEASDPNGIYRIGGALRELLRTNPDDVWPTVWAWLQRDVNAAASFLSSIEFGPDSYLPKLLKERALAELWLWMPKPSPPVDEDDTAETVPRVFEKLNREIISELTGRGTDSAIEALERLSLRAAGDTHYLLGCIEKARQNKTEHAYHPWSPLQLAALAENKCAPFVRDSGHLQDRIATAISGFSLWLQSEHRFQGIWDLSGVPRPKPEPVLSAKLKEYLSAALKGCDITCESEQGLGHTDLRITMPLAESGRPAAQVIVEVKWCDNAGARQELQTQLAAKYLAHTPDATGIYFIGWWNLPEGGGRRKPMWASHAEALADLEFQAKTGQTTGRILVAIPDLTPPKSSLSRTDQNHRR